MNRKSHDMPFGLTDLLAPGEAARADASSEVVMRTAGGTLIDFNEAKARRQDARPATRQDTARPRYDDTWELSKDPTPRDDGATDDPSLWSTPTEPILRKPAPSWSGPDTPVRRDDGRRVVRFDDRFAMTKDEMLSLLRPLLTSK